MYQQPSGWWAGDQYVLLNCKKGKGVNPFGYAFWQGRLQRITKNLSGKTVHIYCMYLCI